MMSGLLRKPVDEVKTTVGSERRGSQPIRGHYPGDVTTLDQSERRGSVPNMERMRLARRRKSIPAYLGYGSVGKSHSSSLEINCFPMFAQIQTSVSDEDIS